MKYELHGNLLANVGDLQKFKDILTTPLVLNRLKGK